MTEKAVSSFTLAEGPNKVSVKIFLDRTIIVKDNLVIKLPNTLASWMSSHIKSDLDNMRKRVEIVNSLEER